MRLLNIDENAVTVQLEASDCLMLAAVLERALDSIGSHLREDELPLYASCGALLMAFEAAGMGADVYVQQSNGDLRDYSLAAVRKEFGRKTGQPPAA